MSCSHGMVRGGNPGLLPLRATIPFQLHNKAQPHSKDAKTGKYDCNIDQNYLRRPEIKCMPQIWVFVFPPVFRFQLIMATLLES